MTVGQLRLTRRTIDYDHDLRGLVGSDRYRVERIGEWFGGGGTERIIGAVAELRLRKPLERTAFIPFVAFSANGSRYREYRTYAAVHGTTDLEVSISFRERRIVNVLALDGTTQVIFGPVPVGEGP